MADDEKPKSENKQPRKVGTHKKIFNKFLKYLDEHKAEIKIYHKSSGGTSAIKYSPKTEHKSLRTLVFDACDFDSMHQVYAYTRELDLKDKISRYEKFRDVQINVLESVHLDFEDDKQMNRHNLDEEEYADFTKFDLYISEIEKGLISDYTPLLAVYPNFGIRVNKMVAYMGEYILNDRLNELESFFLINDLSFHSFEGLIKRATSYVSKSEENERHNFIIQFQNLLEKYKKAYRRSDFAFDNSLLPDYRHFECFFDKPEWSEDDYWWVGGLANKPQTYEDFSNSEKWFLGNRYQTIRNSRYKSLKLDVDDWPDFFLEHIILTGLEWAAVRHVLVETILDEVKNHLNLRALYSKDGSSLTVDQINISITELSN